jgi:hypothetical protein
MMPAGKNTRRSSPPQRSQVLGPSSIMEWITSVVCPQLRHW